MVQHTAILAVADQQKIVFFMIYRTAPFSMTLHDPPPVSRSRPSLTLNISETVRDTDIVLMKYYLHTPYSTVLLRMTLSDLGRLSKIFNDTKRRAVSLRQLRFLFKLLLSVRLFWYFLMTTRLHKRQVTLAGSADFNCSMTPSWN